MEVTAELQTKLRRLIDEKIPVNGTDANTRFETDEIDELLTKSSTVEAAAAEGWALKASRVFSDRGGLVSSAAGDEQSKWVDPEKFAKFCMERSAYYLGLVPGTIGADGGSRIFEINLANPPGVSE